MKIKFYLSVSALLLFLFTGLLFAQQKEEETEKEKAEKLKLQQDVLHYQELETKLLEEAFEQAIDPESYIVGPGDYFSVVLWGDIQKGFQLPVTPEGMLIIPTIGTLKVDGLSLKEVKAVVLQAAKKKYKKTKISTNLMGIRKIRVHVTGEVFKPGTYVSTPTDRVSDLISRAGNLKQYAYIQNIEIKHINGEVETINFSDFKEKGDLQQNPFVQGGDVILIPQIDYSKPNVRVEGFINHPGLYPLIPNETLCDFLSRNDLLDLNQKFTEIQLYRSGEKQRIINLTGAEGCNFKLKNGDKVVLPLKIQQVYVSGAVQKPGIYNYVENLKAKDYVGQAGVNENAGSLNSIKVQHIDKGNIEKGGEASVYPGDVINVPVRNSKRISEYFQIASQVATLIIAYYAIQRNK